MVSRDLSFIWRIRNWNSLCILYNVCRRPERDRPRGVATIKPLLLILTLSLISIPAVYGAEITITNGEPIWYSYDCTDSNPSVWTQSNPNANRFKYFSYYEDTCHATLLTYDTSDLQDLANTTAVNIHIDSKSILLTNRTLSDNYSVNCSLFAFGSPTVTNGVITQTPMNFSSTIFSCTGDSSDLTQSITIPFGSYPANFTENHIQNDNNTDISFMIFPDFNATMRSSIDAGGHRYAIGNYQNDINIIGDGFFCMFIEASGMCNFYYEPWEALKDVTGEDYIGDWYYVMMFFPLPMAVFLATRNGAYAGFTGLGIMLVIQTIDQTVFEIALSMIAISAGFGFYEVIRKRLHE